MTTKVLEAMKQAELAQSSTAVAARQALVKTPKDEGARVVLNIEALPPELETKVRKYYHELHVAMGDFGRAGLKIGSVLREARELLKPLGIWIAFLNRVPGMSAKTGDRFIKRFEMAEKQLSGTLISIAITTGINLAGEDEKQPYGKYTKAVKAIGPPPKETGDKDKDAEKAENWLVKVVTKQQKDFARGRNARKVDPVEKVALQLSRAAVNYVEDKEGQISFLRRVVQRAAKEMGFTGVTLNEPTNIRHREKTAA